MRGDFIENRIDFFAQEFLGGKVLFDHIFGASPNGGFLGGNFDQAADGSLLATTIQIRPLQVPMNCIADKNNSGKHAAEVGGVGHAFTHDAVLGEDQVPNSG